MGKFCYVIQDRDYNVLGVFLDETQAHKSIELSHSADVNKPKRNGHAYYRGAELCAAVRRFDLLDRVNHL